MGTHTIFKYVKACEKGRFTKTKQLHAKDDMLREFFQCFIFLRKSRFNKKSQNIILP